MWDNSPYITQWSAPVSQWDDDQTIHQSVKVSQRGNSRDKTTHQSVNCPSNFHEETERSPFYHFLRFSAACKQKAVVVVFVFSDNLVESVRVIGVRRKQ